MKQGMIVAIGVSLIAGSGMGQDMGSPPPQPAATAAPTVATPALSPNPASQTSPAPTPIPMSSPNQARPRVNPPVPKRSPKPLVALPNFDEETSTRLQVFLDNNNFGPGKIDGRMGEFFRKALINYKIAHGMLPTGAVDKLLAQVPNAYTTYIITLEDLKFVGPTASKPSEQSKLKGLLYGSLLEFVAERFHSAESFLQKLNPGKNLEQLQPGDTLTVPNVVPF